MKFDMHCHTKEGSADGKISIFEYAEILKSKGYNGMLVTDHDSYGGYNAWFNNRLMNNDSECNSMNDFDDDFIVLKGIEYDTIDAGHFLVIMPSDVNLKILELRGLPVYVLMDIVHKHGGILGPAHPYGERYLSIFHTGIYKYHNNIARHFDFLECFNACEEDDSNEEAWKTANAYDKACFGGSDSHKADGVGLGFTQFPDDSPIKNVDDLIKFIKDGGKTTCGGERYTGTIKDKIGRFNNILVQSFWFYNKGLGLARRHSRSKELKEIKNKSDET